MTGLPMGALWTLFLAVHQIWMLGCPVLVCQGAWWSGAVVTHIYPCKTCQMCEMVPGKPSNINIVLVIALVKLGTCMSPHQYRRPAVSISVFPCT